MTRHGTDNGATAASTLHYRYIRAGLIVASVGMMTGGASVRRPVFLSR